MKRYNDYMDNLEVSDTLHEKLNNLETPQKRPAAWKKYGAAAAALVLAAGVGAYGLNRGGWNAVVENFKPAAEVKPEIADVPVPDIAPEDDPYAQTDSTNGGYELIHGELVSYYFLPWLDWVDASALPQTSMDYSLAPLDAVQRDATWDDVLAFTGGERAMADHLLWDGLDWSGCFWFEEDVVPDFVPDYDPTYEDGVPENIVPCAASFYTDWVDGTHLYLEVMKGSEVPSCVVLPDEYYETSQWQGVKITALKNAGYAMEDGVRLNQWVVSLYSNGVGYKLTVYAADAERAGELCARFVRYAVDGGFHLYALSDEPAYDEDLPIEDGGVSDEDSVVMTTPYDPSATTEAKAPTPPN